MTVEEVRPNTKGFRTSDKAWVQRSMIFDEDLPLSPEDILENGPTCGNQAVATAVLRRVEAHSNIKAKNSFELARALWDHLAPDMQTFFREHVHKGRTFTAWFTDEVPLKGTRLPGGKDCTIGFTDFPAMRLVVEEDGIYHINPEVENAFFPVIEMQFSDTDTGEGRVTFALAHDTPARGAQRLGIA